VIRWWVLCLWAWPAYAEEIAAADLVHLPAADVVILGEVHDNPAHHANQAVAVAAIQPRALVFEMLTSEQARRDYDLSDMKAMGVALGWEAAGWPNFAMYYPIFAAAPKAKVFGADMGDAAVRLALDQGAAKAFGADAARYGLDRALTAADQAAREAEQAEAHCGALPADMLPGMVDVQRLRDASLARAVVQAMVATGGPVVVITGSGHARKDRGMPAVLAVAAPGLKVLSVGQVEDAAVDAPFDLWVVSEVPVRDDPCAAFGVPG
jgi:uncharacterized iron-regulated protein